jgi:NAD(P)H dehydrogenase (quinone)
MKSLFEWMGELWIAGSLHDRVASVFAAASTQAAGQELAVISTLAALLQFGMVAVGIPGDLQQPFGVMAGGDGQGGGPSPVELEAARAQGRHVAEIAMRLKRGARAPGGGISRS